jgi:hypothetical protein
VKLWLYPELLDALLVARPPRVDPRLPRWDLARWKAHVSDAWSRYTGVPCYGLAGITVTGLEPIELGPYRVRLLDKRADLLTYLRFADVPVKTCYRSDRRHWSYTSRDVIAVWKDPLSFCFAIERDDEPCGFSFGGAARVDGEPGLVLSGIYLRGRDAGMRDAVMRAIEWALAPFGARHFGIADRRGVPDGYVRRTVTLERLRALREVTGALVTSACDDIGGPLNTPTVVNRLYWRA